MLLKVSSSALLLQVCISSTIIEIGLEDLQFLKLKLPCDIAWKYMQMILSQHTIEELMHLVFSTLLTDLELCNQPRCVSL